MRLWKRSLERDALVSREIYKFILLCLLLHVTNGWEKQKKNMGEEMDKKKKVGEKKRGAVEIRHGVAVSLVREKKRNYVKGIVLLFLYKQRVRVVGSLQSVKI